MKISILALMFGFICSDSSFAANRRVELNVQGKAFSQLSEAEIKKIALLKGYVVDPTNTDPEKMPRWLCNLLGGTSEPIYSGSTITGRLCYVAAK